MSRFTMSEPPCSSIISGHENPDLLPSLWIGRNSDGIPARVNIELGNAGNAKTVELPNAKVYAQIDAKGRLVSLSVLSPPLTGSAERWYLLPTREGIRDLVKSLMPVCCTSDEANRQEEREPVGDFELGFASDIEAAEPPPP